MPDREEASSYEPSDLMIDREGDWYHQGNKIFREEILELLLESVEVTPRGEFLIVWRQQRCALTVEDTPFIIAGVDRQRAEADQDERILMKIKHSARSEALDPDTLWVGEANVLYCRIRGGRFPARFSRPAYYQLTEWVQEDPDSERFYLELNGNRYPIALPE